MKVICDRAALLDGINLVSGVVAARTPRPQLTCVKLDARKVGDAGELTLSATDAEISLVLHSARVDVEEEGEALIPADKLRQIVSAEDAEPTLTLESEGDVCHIRGEDAHFRLVGYPAGEFPGAPEFESVARDARCVIPIQAGPLGQMIARTLFATARENTRYAINGVLLKRNGKKLEMVATDGRRLALARTNAQAAGGKGDEDMSCIVPTKALSMLQKLLGDDEEKVVIAITDNQVLFSIGEGGDARAVLASNLVEGTFPPYEDVIPKDQDKKIVFDRDVLSSAVRRAALLTNEESRGVRMTFRGSDKQLELTSRAPEMGEADIQVHLNSYEGDDIEIGFNPSFITEALKVILEPEIIMELKSQNKPGLIKSGNDFLYVVMPVTI